MSDKVPVLTYVLFIPSIAICMSFWAPKILQNRDVIIGYDDLVHLRAYKNPGSQGNKYGWLGDIIADIPCLRHMIDGNDELVCTRRGFDVDIFDNTTVKNESGSPLHENTPGSEDVISETKAEEGNVCAVSFRPVLTYRSRQYEEFTVCTPFLTCISSQVIPEKIIFWHQIIPYSRSNLWYFAVFCIRLGLPRLLYSITVLTNPPNSLKIQNSKLVLFKTEILFRTDNSTIFCIKFQPYLQTSCSFYFVSDNSTISCIKLEFHFQISFPFNFIPDKLCIKLQRTSEIQYMTHLSYAIDMPVAIFKSHLALATFKRRCVFCRPATAYDTNTCIQTQSDRITVSACNMTARMEGGT